MYSTTTGIALVVLTLTWILTCAKTPSLSAVKSKVKLPLPQNQVATIYDGEDTIYIAGFGFFAYTISTDTITILDATFQDYDGQMAINEDGEIFYFCGASSWSTQAIRKYSVGEGKWREVGALPIYKFQCTVIQPNKSVAYLLGGRKNTNEVLMVNLQDFSVTMYDTITQLGDSPYTTAVWDEDEDQVIIVHSVVNKGAEVMRYSLSEKKCTLVSDELPEMSRPMGVWSGKNVYLVPAYGEEGGAKENDGVIQVDPETGHWTFVPIKKYPYEGSWFLSSGTLIVGKEKRIYVFGGCAVGRGDKFFGSVHIDTIWWMDVGALSIAGRAFNNYTNNKGKQDKDEERTTLKPVRVVEKIVTNLPNFTISQRNLSLSS